MRKGTMSNMIQRGIIFGCVMLVAMSVVFTRGNTVKAWDDKKKGEECSLESVVLEIDGEDYVVHGDLQPIVVPSDVKWSEFLASIQIKDYNMVTSDTCTHENHTVLVGDLYSWADDASDDGYYSAEFLKFNNGISSNALEQEIDEIEVEEDRGYYEIEFTANNGYISVYFTKSYKLAYDLGEGEFPEGMEVPATYSSCVPMDLPFPERDNYIFTGWTILEGDNPIYREHTRYGQAGDTTYIANWEMGDRIDLSTCTIEMDDDIYTYSYEGEAIEPGFLVTYQADEESEVEYLEYGNDYIVSYKNNIEVADRDSENAPTIVITGIGRYKGRMEETFTICKAIINDEEMEYALYVENGATLSTIDMCSLEKWWESHRSQCPGTWSWTNPDTIVEGSAGEEFGYAATFTPTDTAHYEIEENMLYVIIREPIDEWTITFDNKNMVMYTGEACEPDVTVKHGDCTMEEGVDYRVSYVNNTAAADKTEQDAPAVVITGMDYYVGTKNVTFTIEKAIPSIEEAPVASAIESGKKLSDSTLMGGKVIDGQGDRLEGSFDWKDGTVVPGLTDSNVTKYTVVFTPTDTANYEIVEMDILVKVNEKEPDSTPEENSGQTQTPTPGQTPTPTPDQTPTPTPDQTPTPTPDQTPNSVPETQPAIAVGDRVNDQENKAAYQVTKSAEGKVEVMYIAPAGKTKQVNIPATVVLADGTVAKVTSIAAKAFKKNTKLQKVTIGKNVKTIGKEAFSGCKNLKNIKIKTTKLTKKNVKKNAFKGIHRKVKIDVPNSKAKDYKKIFTSRGIGKKATIK